MYTELQRGYSEDVAENDDMMMHHDDDRGRSNTGVKRGKSMKAPPQKPTRSGSSRQLQQQYEGENALDPTKLPRASSEMQLNRSKTSHGMTPDPESKEEKKKSRGKSPFR